jgi:hypothetical protein
MCPPHRKTQNVEVQKRHQQDSVLAVLGRKHLYLPAGRVSRASSPLSLNILNHFLHFCIKEMENGRNSKLR